MIDQSAIDSVEYWRDEEAQLFALRAELLDGGVSNNIFQRFPTLVW